MTNAENDTINVPVGTLVCIWAGNIVPLGLCMLAVWYWGTESITSPTLFAITTVAIAVCIGAYFAVGLHRIWRLVPVGVIVTGGCIVIKYSYGHICIDNSAIRAVEIARSPGGTFERIIVSSSNRKDPLVLSSRLFGSRFERLKVAIASGTSAMPQ